MRRAREFLASFTRKFFHDALPVAFASLLGALALTYFVHDERAQPATHSAAGEEMVRMVHEEHGLIVDFLRQQARKQEAEANGQDMAQKMDAAAEKAAASRQIAQTETVPLPVPRATAMRLAAEQSRAEAKLAQTAQPLTQQVLAGQVLTQTIVPQQIVPQPPLQPMPVVAAAPRKHGVGDTVRGIVTGTRDAAVSAWAKVTGGVIERVRLPRLPDMPDLMPRREFQARM